VTSPDRLDDHIWRTVLDAPPVRRAQVCVGRERLATGNWPSGLQLADCLLAGWFRRLVLPGMTSHT
jgi:hypothetical protein